MSTLKLDHDVMKCFEDAVSIVSRTPKDDPDTTALAAVIIQVGEAICVQLEKNRIDVAERHTRLQDELGRIRLKANEEVRAGNAA